MKMRKLLAGIAAAATLLGCAALGTASASADDTGATITIMNAQQGHTYKAYKVATFSNVKVDGDTITSMDIDTVQNDNLQTALKGAITKAGQTLPGEYENNPMAFVATFNAAAARQFADCFLEGTIGLPDVSDTKIIADDGSAPNTAVLNVPEGWYLVTDSENGTDFKTALIASTVQGKTKFKTVQTEEQAALDGTLGSFYVKKENAPLAPVKNIYKDGSYTNLKNTKSVNIGDTLHYQVRTSVPKAATGRADYTITFKDNASNGLQINQGSITVCHKAKDAAAGEQCSAIDPANVNDSYVGDASSGTVTTVVVSGVSKYVGDYVFLRYTATVTADVLGSDGTGRVLHNEATVKHADGAESEAGETTQYVGDLKFYKYGEENGGKVNLSGVKFTVHRGTAAAASSGNADLKFSLVDSSVAGVYKYDPVNGSATISTGEGGVLQLKGLEEGDYTFVETEPATGYAKNFMPTFSVNMDITPNSASAVAAPLIENPLTSYNNGWKLASNWTDPSDNSERVRVKNVKSITQLPLTGGAGIILFSVIAALLIAVAAVVTVKIRSVRRELQN